MRIIGALLIILFASPVAAGSLSFQVVETGQTTLTKTYALSNPDVDRIVAAEQSDANVAVNGVATRAQVLQNWVSKLIAATKLHVAASESAAAQAALPAITPINPQ